MSGGLDRHEGVFYFGASRRGHDGTSARKGWRRAVGRGVVDLDREMIRWLRRSPGPEDVEWRAWAPGHGTAGQSPPRMRSPAARYNACRPVRDTSGLTPDCSSPPWLSSTWKKQNNSSRFLFTTITSTPSSTALRERCPPPSPSWHTHISFAASLSSLSALCSPCYHLVSLPRCRWDTTLCHSQFLVIPLHIIRPTWFGSRNESPQW